MANRTKAFPLIAILSFSLCSVTSHFAYAEGEETPVETERIGFFHRHFPITWERINDRRKKKEEAATQGEPKKDETTTKTSEKKEPQKKKATTVESLRKHLQQVSPQTSEAKQQACVEYGVEILNGVVADTREPGAGDCNCQELTDLKEVSYPLFKEDGDDTEIKQWVWLWFPHYRTDKPYRHESKKRFWKAVETKCTQLREKAKKADDTERLSRVAQLAHSYQRALETLT